MSAGEKIKMSFVVRLLLICGVFTYVSAADEELNASSKGLHVLTVATEANDGFRRFARSVKQNKLPLHVLGMGKTWTGGDMSHPGGGQKIRLLRDVLETVKDNKDLILMFTDSYDVVFTGGEEEVMKAFLRFDARVVFSAEGFCWPDPNLAESYPQVKVNEKRYLNSGGFIGYAPELYRIVTDRPVKDGDDDQLYYTRVFLDAPLREKLHLKLDTRGELFQNLHGALDDVELKFKGASSYLYNAKTGNQPIVVHGNGPIKPQFNSLTNYLANSWTMTMGCQHCKEDVISLKGIANVDLPRVFLALFLHHPIPFVEEFFKGVAGIDYPKEKMDLFIHYSTAFHEKHVTSFMDEHGMAFNSARVYAPDKQLNDWSGRNQALEDCVAEMCRYLFTIDGEVQIDNPSVLRHLIQTNRSVIAPFANRPNKMWSNFWGALSVDGFYKRANDYSDIVLGKRRGIWNVPYVANVVLMHGFRVQELLGGYVQGNIDPDMALAKTARDKNIFLYVDNQEDWGHLVDSEDFSTEHLNNDMFTLFSNPTDWEQKYIHPDYRQQLEEGFVIDQPCPDVFWAPAISVRFTQDLIAEMEHNGEWSGGKNEDPRISGGYENVPTVDIHMNQIGFETHWLHFIKTYIAPINQKIYIGYYTESRAIMNFVVRYRLGEQDRLRPHHDASTYTINIALNRPVLDYQGGGVHFLRYNCTVTSLRQGWMLMHPGRLTHMHEGLQTTGGTRYIMISFIDP